MIDDARLLSPSHDERDLLAWIGLVVAEQRGTIADLERQVRTAEANLRDADAANTELTRERDALLEEVERLKRGIELAEVPDPPVEFDGIVPVLAGVGVSVAGVVETFRAGHSMAEVARLFSVSEAHVEAAIRWHGQQGKKRRRR